MCKKCFEIQILNSNWKMNHFMITLSLHELDWWTYVIFSIIGYFVHCAHPGNNVSNQVLYDLNKINLMNFLVLVRVLQPCFPLHCGPAGVPITRKDKSNRKCQHMALFDAHGPPKHISWVFWWNSLPFWCKEHILCSKIVDLGTS